MKHELFGLGIARRFLWSKDQRLTTLSVIVVTAVLLGLIGTLATTAAGVRRGVETLGDSPEFTRMTLVIRDSAFEPLRLSEIVALGEANNADGIKSATPWLSLDCRLSRADGQTKRLTVRSTYASDPDLSGVTVPRNGIAMTDRLANDLGYGRPPKTITLTVRRGAAGDGYELRTVELAVTVIKSNLVFDRTAEAYLAAETAADLYGWTLDMPDVAFTRAIIHARGQADVENVDRLLRQRFGPRGYQVVNELPKLRQYRMISESVDRITLALTTAATATWAAVLCALTEISRSAVRSLVGFVRHCGGSGRCCMILRGSAGLMPVGFGIVIGFGLCVASTSLLVHPSLGAFGIAFAHVSTNWPAVLTCVLIGVALPTVQCAVPIRESARPPIIAATKNTR